MSLPKSTQVRLAHQLDSLFLFIKDMPLHRLQEPGRNGKWSIAQNMAHLARYQEVFIQRLDRMQQEELPGLPAYCAETDPAWKMIWLNTEHHLVTRHLQETRKDLIELMATYSAAQLKRVGLHPRFGAMNVVEWMEFFLLHEAHHLYAILRTRQEI